MPMRIVVVCFFVFLFFSCSEEGKDSPEFVVTEDFPIERILAKGTLDVATFYNSTDYYTYKGITRGFHYELAKDFANFLGVKLQIVEVDNNLPDAIDKLQAGRYDLLAVSLTETAERADSISFCHPFFDTEDVLVQSRRNVRVNDLQDLEGKEVFLQKGAPAKKLLEHLMDSLHFEVEIVEVENFSYEDILHLVETGEIDYTITDANVAKASGISMKNLDYSVALDNHFSASWAIGRESVLLADAVNDWLCGVKRSGKFNFLYNRYFNNHGSVPSYRSKYSMIRKGGLSPFDELLKRESKRLNWDWKLLAALVYTESQFNPEVESPYGACGLMQVMPETAELFRVKDYFRPDSNVYAGVQYLRYLDDLFKEQLINPEERLNFTLASYNVGAGHVRDAMRLAEKYEKDPQVWKDNVDFFLLNKSKPEFYKDPASRNGYCDGKQVTEYVQRVLETYNNYRNTSVHR